MPLLGDVTTVPGLSGTASTKAAHSGDVSTKAGLSGTVTLHKGLTIVLGILLKEDGGKILTEAGNNLAKETE